MTNLTARTKQAIVDLYVSTLAFEAANLRRSERAEIDAQYVADANALIIDVLTGATVTELDSANVDDATEYAFRYWTDRKYQNVDRGAVWLTERGATSDLDILAAAAAILHEASTTAGLWGHHNAVRDANALSQLIRRVFVGLRRSSQRLAA